MKTILMKFQSPLQSYGTDSHFETRHTDDHPSKAAVIGMAAAALGVRREEVDRLKPLEELKMIVRVDQVGKLNKDYQIAAKYKKSGDFERNYVTNRYYLEDAIFLVALEGEDTLIEHIYEAFKRPYFQLYYGKRSCPVNYDFLIGSYEGAAYKIVQEFPWIAADWYQKRHSKLEKIRLDIYGDEICIQDADQKSIRRDWPNSFSQRGRQHSLRFEVHKNIWIDNPCCNHKYIQTEHDAFEALTEE